MNQIDFRSDTVTWPTQRMREAIAAAELGDDVYGEDPTVNELQELAADMLGMEAALLVSSGTQGNLTCMLTHAGRGEQAIIGEDAHVFTSEAGGMAALGGIVPKPLPTDRVGRMDLDQVAGVAARLHDAHYPRSRLICAENSSGSNNGAAIPPNYFAGLREVADRYDLRVHLDGARFFNAVTALAIDPREMTQHLDSISICLSKGLCAPVGSVIAGSRAFIERAHRNRKILGGGMRQAGIIAAAGLIALRDMTRRLDEDHRHARLLAERLARLPGIEIDPAVVTTNLVFFRLKPGIPLSQPQVAAELRDRYGVLIGGYAHQNLFRAVTHYWVGEEEIDRLVTGLATILMGTAV